MPSPEEVVDEPIRPVTGNDVSETESVVHRGLAVATSTDQLTAILPA
jgi:hypothetical protein